MTNSSIKVVAVLVLCMSAAALAEKDLESIYRERYAQDMYARLSDAIDRGLFLKNYAREDAKSRVRIFVSLAADCQMAAFEYFDPKYKQIAFREVASGKSIAESTAIANTEMLLDVANGKMTQEELENIVLKSKQEAAKCSERQMKKAGL